MSFAARTTSADPLEAFLETHRSDRHPVPLVGTSIDIRIVAGLAVVVAERTFRNSESVPIEATMTFPVPIHATIVSLKASVDGRALVGTTKRKTDARAVYEKAVDDGRSSVLHEQLMPGIHMLSVTHVRPGAEIVVKTEWAMPLAVMGTDVSVSIPTTVGQIYGTSPLQESDDPETSDFVHRADVVVSADTGIARLVGAERGADGIHRVALDRPVVVVISGWKPSSATGTSADGRIVTMTFAPATAGDQPVRCDLLLDASGSMATRACGAGGEDRGSKFDVAVGGIATMAARLSDSDHVELWTFDNRPKYVGSLRDGIVSVLRSKEPRGGTEIGLAMDAVAESGGSDVLLITDGKSHAAGEHPALLEMHGRARSGKRYTVVLVGEDALEANVGHLAANSGGQLFAVSDADVGRAVVSALDSMRAPRPSSPPIEGAPTQVRAAIAGMDIEAHWSEAGEIGEPSPHGRVVGAIAAALAIPRMDADDAAALAEAEGIVTHLTSLVLVDEEGTAQEAVPAHRKVALSRPATMSMTASSACSAASANASAGVFRSYMATSGAHSESRRVLYSMHAGRSMAGNPPETCLDGVRTLSGIREQGRMLPTHPVPPSGWPPAPRRPDGLPIVDRLVGGSGTLPVVAPPTPPSPVVPPDDDANAPSIFARCIGRIDWSTNPEHLRRGDVSGLDPVLRDTLKSLARVPFVMKLALVNRMSSMVAALGLLARAEAAGNRGAARFARAVFSKADPDVVAAARKTGLG